MGIQGERNNSDGYTEKDLATIIQTCNITPRQLNNLKIGYTRQDGLPQNFRAARCWDHFQSSRLTRWSELKQLNKQVPAQTDTVSEDEDECWWFKKDPKNPPTETDRFKEGLGDIDYCLYKEDIIDEMKDKRSLPSRYLVRDTQFAKYPSQGNFQHLLSCEDAEIAQAYLACIQG